MQYRVLGKTGLKVSAVSMGCWGIGGQWKAGPFLVFGDYLTSDAGGDDSAW